MAGASLAEFKLKKQDLKHIAIKEAVFPFDRFPGVDTVLGPEMKSTGEVMGIDTTFANAYAKSQIGAGNKLPLKGTVFVSVRNEDKSGVVPAIRDLVEMGFSVLATGGTQRFLEAEGIDCKRVNKVLEGRPDVTAAIKNGEVHLVFNTTQGKKAVEDSAPIRRTALLYHLPYYTTLAGAIAVVPWQHDIQHFLTNHHAHVPRQWL